MVPKLKDFQQRTKNSRPGLIGRGGGSRSPCLEAFGQSVCKKPMRDRMMSATQFLFWLFQMLFLIFDPFKPWTQPSHPLASQRLDVACLSALAPQRRVIPSSAPSSSATTGWAPPRPPPCPRPQVGDAHLLYSKNTDDVNHLFRHSTTLNLRFHYME